MKAWTLPTTTPGQLFAWVYRFLISKTRKWNSNVPTTIRKNPLPIRCLVARSGTRFKPSGQFDAMQLEVLSAFINPMLISQGTESSSRALHQTQSRLGRHFACRRSLRQDSKVCQSAVKMGPNFHPPLLPLRAHDEFIETVHRELCGRRCGCSCR